MDSKVSVSVISSCIGRDLFSFDDARYEFKTDIRFTSPFTIANNPIPKEYMISKDDFINPTSNYDSNWFHKNLINDVNKVAFDSLTNLHGDWVVVDLADARINIAEVTFKDCQNEKYYISNSLPFKLHYNASLKLNKLKDIEIKEKNPLEFSMDEWESQIKNYKKRLLEIFSPDHIILIENYCLPYFIDSDGRLKYFTEQENINMIKTSKDLFKNLYKFFLSEIPDCVHIKIPPYAVSNVENKWGKHPLHMDKEYYCYLLKCIDAITSGNKNKIDSLYNEYTYIFKNILENAELKTNLIDLNNKNLKTDFLSTFRFKNISKELILKFFICSEIYRHISLDYSFENIYHYGIENQKITSYMSDKLSKTYNSTWLYPDNFKKPGVLIVDKLDLGKGISIDNCCECAKKINNNQTIISINNDLNQALLVNKDLHIFTLTCILGEIENKVCVITKDQYVIDRLLQGFNKEIYLLDLNQILIIKQD